MHDVARITETEPLSDLTPFAPSWNIAPQTFIPVGTQTGVHGETDAPRHFRLMRWGLRPSWSKPSNREPINARSETMHDKPMFRRAAQTRRGFVPANGWYEWMTTPQGKVPWFHHRMDGGLSFLAVLWETWTSAEEHVESCVLLTQEANDDCKDVHNRMPVVLDNNGLEAWLASGTLPSPPEPGFIDRHPVSRDVNNAHNDHPRLVKPLVGLFNQEYGA